LRVILSIQFCTFFDLLFWVRHADEWQSTCSNSIEWKKIDDFNFTLQKDLPHLARFGSSWHPVLGLQELLEVFWGRSLTNYSPLHVYLRARRIFAIFFGKVFDQLYHFTCKSMEIHISIWKLFAISTTIFDQLST
jgi:hypothetical protein